MFDDNDIYEAAEQLGSWVGLLTHGWDQYRSEVLLKKIESKLKFEKSPKMEALFTLLKNCTVEEAMTFGQVLNNAIEHTKFGKTKEWKMKEMGIDYL